MKRNYTFLMSAFMLLAMFIIPMGMRGQTRAEVVAYTLDGTQTGGSSGYDTESDITQNNISWKVKGNTTMNPWRIGGKSISGVDRPMYSTNPIADNITKIEVKHGTASGITVNSWTVIVASDASFTNVVSTLTPTFTASATTTINRPTGADWTGCYYKFIYNVTVSQSSNKFVQFEGADFFKQEGSGPLIATPTFDPIGGVYTSTQNVTISCETQGSTIYYTTNGSTPNNNSTQYNGAITVSETTTINAIAYVGNDASSVATATYTIVNLDHAGTLADPYTVADARAAIDANVGVTGVYATGIVSEIVTAYNSTYGNITFDIVDEVGNSATLRAYRCGGTEAANVAVNDIVVVYGDLTKYGSTYEFGQDCQLVSLTHPAVVDPTVTVTPNTINAPAEGADGTLAITYENIENFISFDYYFCDANGGELEDTDPDWINAEINEENDDYILSYSIDANQGEARTAYIKVYTSVDEEEIYAIVTINQEEYVAPTYAVLPFAFNDGKAAIEETDGLYQEGLGTDYNATNNPTTKLKFDGSGDWLLLQFDERPGTLTFDIKGNSFSGGTFKVQTSEDGVTYTDLETYTEITDIQNEEFTDLGENVRYIKWIYTTKASGNVGLGNIALAEYVAPALVASITVNPDEVNVDAEEHDGTLDLTYENLTITDMTDFDIQFCDANGDELSEEPDWIEVLVAEQDPTIGEGYVVSYYMVENEGPDARTAYFKVYSMDDETNLVYSNLVTISQAAPVVPPTPGNWVLTDLADLTANDVFVIVGDNGSTFAMPVDGGGQNGAPAAVAVTVVEGTLSGEPAANLQWNISITEDGYTFYPNGETETWLYCTNTNNGVRVGTNENNVFTMSENGYLYNTATERYIGIYNSQDWRCYTNTTGNIANQTFAFYKKVAEPATEYVLTVKGYAEGDKGGYVLIASPVTVDPATVEGMTTGEYDLYSFDEAEEDEWRNYKAGAFTNLEPGKGYLYAKQATEPDEVFQFTLTGTAYDGEPIVLSKSGNGDFSGWNLVGNPYNELAYIDRDYYVMNETGDNFIEGSGAIAPMQGIFVIAEENGETMTFRTEAPANDGKKLTLNINRNRGNVIDRAVVRFGNSRQLPKLMLNEDATKVYLSKNGNDYAVVRSENSGMLPVFFQASENGDYTINVAIDNVTVNYLHLVDNVLGEDINLLENPSYKFEAKTTDEPKRFVLVYRTGINPQEMASKLVKDADFSFYNDGRWLINNEGEATLQVIDVQGRILSNEQIRGSISKHIEAAPGVYMMRLINGNDVKTQKIVIER